MLDKQKSRELRVEIRCILMEEWDPIGVKDEPNAADEYDAYLGDVLSLLVSHSSKEDVARFLLNVESKRMGLVDAEGRPFVTIEKLLPIALKLKHLDLS